MKSKLNLSVFSLLAVMAMFLASCSSTPSDHDEHMDHNKDMHSKHDMDNHDDMHDMKVVTKCPVSGKNADMDVKSIMHDGYKIHFYSDKCAETFMKDPEMYMAKIKENPKMYVKDYNKMHKDDMHTDEMHD